MRIQTQAGHILKDITNSVILKSKMIHVAVQLILPKIPCVLSHGTSTMPDHDSSTTRFKSVLSWKQLDVPLQTVLPNDSKYTYVIEEFQPKTSEYFEVRSADRPKKKCARPGALAS
jgi:hypothetical protein